MQPGPYASAAPLSPPAMSDQQVRPAKSWFVVAGLIAVVGIIAAVVILVRGITGYADRVDDFDRADLPGTLQVEITDTGGYSIYHEYQGAYDDDFSFSTEPDVTVTDPSGDPVTLDRYDGSITYNVSGHEGEGLYTFDADEPGTYEVNATGEPGNGIAVGRGIGRGLVAAIIGSLAVGLVAILAGAVLAIVVGVRRSSSRRALMPPPQFSGWGPPPPPGWGGPPGPAGGYGAPGGGYGAGAYGAPGASGTVPAPPPPPPPPPPSGPTDAPAPPPSSGPIDAPASPAPPLSSGPIDGPAPPADSSSPPGNRASGTSMAFGGVGARTSRPIAPATRRDTAAAPLVADPPSLRAPVDWARSDVPLPWSSQS